VENVQDSAISNAIQWLCSPRGGNNFYGRVMNGVRRIHLPGLNSVGVNIDDAGHFFLAYDLAWFETRSVEEQLYIIQHEACHLILRHIERVTHMYKKLSCGATLENRFNLRIINIAMDAAINGGLLKKEMDALGAEQPFVDPARDFQFPNNLTFDEYLALLIEKAEVISIASIACLSEGKGKNEGGAPTEGESTEQNEGGAPTEGESTEQNDKDFESEGKSQNNEDYSKNEEQPVDDSKREEFPKHVCDYSKQLGQKTEAELERMETEMKKTVIDIVKKAYEQTMRRRGTIPSGVKQIVDALLQEPQVPWEHIFRNMLRSSIAAKMVESALIPNYALLPVMCKGILPYPGMQNDLSFNISVHIDTSGSISDQDFITFMTEVAGIIKSVSGIKMHLLMFDAVIQYEEFLSVADVDQVHRQLKTYGTNTFDRYGRGGTDFCPSFKRMVGAEEYRDRSESCGGNFEEHRMFKPDLMVFLTDGCSAVKEEQGGPIPRYKPECPVIWVICGGSNGTVDDAMGQLVVVLND